MTLNSDYNNDSTSIRLQFGRRSITIRLPFTTAGENERVSFSS